MWNHIYDNSQDHGQIQETETCVYHNLFSEQMLYDVDLAEGHMKLSKSLTLTVRVTVFLTVGKYLITSLSHISGAVYYSLARKAKSH